MIDFKEKANLIWKVADLLRGDYKQSDYGKVILPMTVLRRLDSLLIPTKEKVLGRYDRVKNMSASTIDATLNKEAGFNFHNHSAYDFKKLVAEPNNIAANLRNFINGFSTSAREIIDYFNFDDHITRLDDPQTDLLFQVVEAFEAIDLKSMTSMEMGYVFEELIRKFAELSNETAGEHFTPREVIRLMVDLIFTNDREMLTKRGIVKTLYDPACGTGGMLSIAEEYVKELNPDGDLRLFGQEINPESYAICKSDMLIKGQDPSNIKFGNTFTVDGLANEKFDYMLSNPPFGVDWKKAQKIVKHEHEEKGHGGRFGAGLPRINDGSFLFLQHMISKMQTSNGGSRIAIVFNGSPLFTGGAGSGESEIRRWIIENDMLEAVVALPDQLFYNTGIATYTWIVTNRKDKARKGLVQLINANGQKDEELVAQGQLPANRFWFKKDRSLGNKRKEIGDGLEGRPNQIATIAKIYGEFQEGPFCQILPNDFFAYRRITIEQPLKNEDGKVVTNSKGQPKPDTSKRDYENVPLLREENGQWAPQDIQTYFDREVKPHVPDAWIDESKCDAKDGEVGIKGYEINFSRYFYEFKPLRSLADIRKDILALEAETEGLIKKVIE